MQLMHNDRIVPISGDVMMPANRLADR